MSDVTQLPTDKGTESTPSHFILNRPVQRINHISDFFRPRSNAAHVVPVQPTTSPPSPQHPPFRLIPSQVIRTQSEVSTIFTETPPPYAHQELEVVSLPQQLTTQQQLLQAQRLWKAMFRTSTGIPTTDSQRPIVLSVENQRANSSWGDQLGEKQDGVTRIYGMNVKVYNLIREADKWMSYVKF
jgi:hypothetical protein